MYRISSNSASALRDETETLGVNKKTKRTFVHFIKLKVAEQGYAANEKNLGWRYRLEKVYLTITSKRLSGIEKLQNKGFLGQGSALGS